LFARMCLCHQSV